MANGYSLGMLQLQKEVTKNATPEFKLEPYGLTASLYQAHSPASILNNPESGHIKTVKVKAKKRWTPDDISPEPGCDVMVRQAYTEQSVDVSNFCQIALHIEDSVIEQYDEYASAIVNGTATKPSTSLMQEHYLEVMRAGNALLSSMNQGLWALAVAAVGVNRRTGNTATSAINIPLNTTNEPLGDGINRILTDYMLNTMTGRPIAIGQGNMHGFMLAQAAKANVNQSGVDTRIQAAGFDFFYDPYAGTALGNANQILVYEKDAIQIVEKLRYKGFKRGPKPGASTYGTIVLPMQSGNQLVPVEFDFQLRYNDCEQEITEGYNGSTVTIQPGYNLIMSKYYGLYTIPSTAYDSGDVLSGNRGSLRYTITNT